MKNYFVYKDEEVKNFDHVTMVKGSFGMKHGARNELCIAIREVSGTGYALDTESDIVKKGVSKCSPEDEFDAKTGLVIASRKAELKANKEVLNLVVEARKAAEKYLDMLKDMEDKLDYKVGKLALDLIAFNRRGTK